MKPEQDKLDDTVVVPEPGINERVTEEIASQERDYTAERNSRVIPMVKSIIFALGDFHFDFNRDNTPESALGERTSFSEFVRLQFFPSAFANQLKEADLNYFFKLMGTTLQMLQARANTPADVNDERLTMAAQSILKKLGSQETLMIDFHADALSDPDKAGLDRAALYDSLYQTVVLETFEQFGIKHNEAQHVFTLMKSIKDELKDKVSAEIESAKKVVEMKAWGVHDLDDLDILTIHKKVVE